MSRHPRLGLIAIAVSIVFLLYYMANPGVSTAALDRIKNTASSFYDDRKALAQEQLNEAHLQQAAADALGKPSHNKPASGTLSKTNERTFASDSDDIKRLVHGKPIANKMTNQTARSELGRAAWKMIHTILAQYPDEPTEEEQDALSNYLYLFSRIYPCRECAEHFQVFLQKYPPQVKSKQAAMMWGCDLHNKVNRRLGKPIFDCANIADAYDCGCSDDDEDDSQKADGAAGKEKTVPAVKGG